MGNSRVGKSFVLSKTFGKSRNDKFAANDKYLATPGLQWFGNKKLTNYDKETKKKREIELKIYEVGGASKLE